LGQRNVEVEALADASTWEQLSGNLGVGLKKEVVDKRIDDDSGGHWVAGSAHRSTDRRGVIGV
jgi:hypothetical protein